MPAIISSRTVASADGDDSFTSSSVRTMIPAAFAKPSETVASCMLVTGLALPCPTHEYVPPAV